MMGDKNPLRKPNANKNIGFKIHPLRMFGKNNPAWKGGISIGNNSKDYYREAHFIYFNCAFEVVSGELTLDMKELTEAKWVAPKESLKMDLGGICADSIKKYTKLLE